MANVMFKRGLQSQLPQTAQDGVFYLTTDSNRLYIGNSAGKMSLLNQTVQIVKNVAALPLKPETNDFYYCEEENILAVWNGGSEWIQINKDTNDIVKITKVEQGKGYKDENDLVYPLTISQSKTSKNGAEDTSFDGDVKFEIRISKSDLEEVIFKPANVGLTGNVANNTITLSTKGEGSDSSSSVSMTAGENITISVDDDGKAVISAEDTLYELYTTENSNQGSLTLKDGNGDETEVKFLAGQNLTVSSDDENNITYEHEQIETTDEAVTNNTLDFGDNITLVSGIDTNNGHITKITTTTAKIPDLPDDIHIEEIINEKDSSGNIDPDWKVQIKETSGQTFDISFEEDARKLQEDLEKLIEDGLAVANTALVYKGGVDAYSALPTENVEIGDVYLLTKESGDYKVGDLFIAVSTNPETTSGVIASDDLDWTYVPSGDELNTDTYFKGDVEFDATNNQVSFAVVANEDSDGQIVEVTGNEILVLKGGTDINISNDSGAAKISHKTYSDPTPSETEAASNKSFTAITDLTTENGHITGIEKETFDILEYELLGKDNKIILKDSDGDETDFIEVAGDPWITAGVDADKLTISHKNTANSGKEVGTDNSTPSLAANGKFKIISKVGYDDAGHVTNVETQELTLPEDNNTEYNLFVGSKNNTTINPVETNSVENPYIVLNDTNGDTDLIQVTSQSLNIKGEKEKINIDLVWGSFN